MKIRLRIRIRTGILRWGRGHNIGGGRCAGDADECDGGGDGDDCVGDSDGSD